MTPGTSLDRFAVRDTRQTVAVEEISSTSSGTVTLLTCNDTLPSNGVWLGVPAALGLSYLQSLCAMRVTMGFLSAQEQLRTQHICPWFYKYGTSRVQTRIRLCKILFTLKSHNLISVTPSGKVTMLTCNDTLPSYALWLGV